jgi:integrase
MGRKSFSGGVRSTCPGRIQFTFQFNGTRYRPTLPWVPTEANVRRARQHLVGIKARIVAGTFSFAEEFPDYRHLNRTPREGCARTCGQVFDEYLAHCQARVARYDLASVTLTTYRRTLDHVWRPAIGARRFLDVSYSELVQIADTPQWGKKAYNNAVSVLRRAFKFGYRNHPDRHDPTRELKGARIQCKDRPIIDPFTLDEAEALVAAIRKDWGSAQANYDEFRFFTGLRPSEEIALRVSDYDAVRGTLDVTKARVDGIDKDCTKTGDDRRIALSPRAIGVLKRHLAFRGALVRGGVISHDFLFFKADGQPICNLQYPGMRWQRTLRRLTKIRYRRPYIARHTSVSWDLMIGRSALWVARQHGHSISTMLRFYAAWAGGTPESDVERIRAAINSERSLQKNRARVGDPQITRPIARPFEMEFPPSPQATEIRFATGFATNRRTPAGKSLKGREKTDGREGFERPLAGSASYGFRRKSCPRGSPGIPIAVTGAVTDPNAIFRLSNTSRFMAQPRICIRALPVLAI